MVLVILGLHYALVLSNLDLSIVQVFLVLYNEILDPI